MAAIESASSWCPQPNSQSPPMAQAPKPISVMCRSELPSLRVIIVYLHLGATVGHWCRRLQVFTIKPTRVQLLVIGPAPASGRKSAPDQNSWQPLTTSARGEYRRPY